MELSCWSIKCVFSSFHLLLLCLWLPFFIIFNGNQTLFPFSSVSSPPPPSPIDVPTMALAGQSVCGFNIYWFQIIKTIKVLTSLDCRSAGRSIGLMVGQNSLCYDLLRLGIGMVLLWCWPKRRSVRSADINLRSYTANGQTLGEGMKGWMDEMMKHIKDVFYNCNDEYRKFNLVSSIDTTKSRHPSPIHAFIWC